MHITNKAVRAALIALSLTLAALASGPSIAEAGCVNGTNRWVWMDACCYASGSVYQKWMGQSCIYGSWVDNGARKCSGLCAM